MTKSGYNFDARALGNFVDGQLDAAHNEKIIKAMEDDPEIRERVYQFRRTKDLMKLGYGDVRAPSSNTVKSKFRIWKLLSLEIAASIAALAFAFAAGMLGHSYYGEPMADATEHAVASTSISRKK
jgi:anti-sigma factor RsiW